MEAGGLVYCKFSNSIRNIDLWRKYGIETGGVICNITNNQLIGLGHAFKLTDSSTY